MPISKTALQKPMTETDSKLQESDAVLNFNHQPASTGHTHIYMYHRIQCFQGRLSRLVIG